MTSTSMTAQEVGKEQSGLRRQLLRPEPQQDRGERSGTGDERKGQGKDRDVGPPAALGRLAARGARAGFAREHHFERQQKEQQAAEDAEKPRG